MASGRFSHRLATHLILQNGAIAASSWPVAGYIQEGAQTLGYGGGTKEVDLHFATTVALPGSESLIEQRISDPGIRTVMLAVAGLGLEQLINIFDEVYNGRPIWMAG